MNEARDRKPTASAAGPKIYGDGGFQRLLVRQNEEHKQQLAKERRRRLWDLSGSIGGMVAALLGAALSFWFSYYSRPHDTLTDRIATLTKSLNDSAQIISDIEQEVNRRQSLLEKLQRDADEAKNLAALNSAQANAVVQALREELNTESNKGWWASIIQGLIFAVLGAVFGLAASELWRKLRPRTAVAPTVINNLNADAGTPDEQS